MPIVNQYRKTPDIYPILDVRAVDGDTLEARIVLPFGQSITKRIRLKGWWADEPEGLYAAQGQLARAVLTQWITNKVLWIHAPSCRLDRYGRVLAHLMHANQIVNPRDVLGACQLTEKEHNARRAQGKAASRQATAQRPYTGGISTAEAESKSLISDPRAKCTARNSISGHPRCCDCIECYPKPPYRPTQTVLVCSSCPAVETIRAYGNDALLPLPPAVNPGPEGRP